MNKTIEIGYIALWAATLAGFLAIWAMAL